ncbi:MAG: PAS domain-containing protein, partial [Gemmatimonadaceae bacterium]
MLRLSLRPNVVAAYLSALLVCAMSALAYHSVDRATAATAQSASALAVMDALRAVDDRVRDVSFAAHSITGQGDPVRAAAYTEATSATVSSLARLREIATPYPAASSLDSLGYFVGLRLATLDEMVRMRRDSGAKLVVHRPDVTDGGDGGDSAARINDLLGSISAIVSRSDARSTTSITWQASRVLAVAIVISGLAILLALFVNIMHARNVRAQRTMVEELENQSLQLQLQASELTVTNSELESATAEMLHQTVEAERSETRLRGILGSATDAVVSFDDNECIVYYNAATRRLFGRDDTALAGARILSVVSEKSLGA